MRGWALLWSSQSAVNKGMDVCMQDAVPKAVMHFLVLRVQRGLQQHLIKSLYRCTPHLYTSIWAPHTPLQLLTIA